MNQAISNVPFALADEDLRRMRRKKRKMIGRSYKERRDALKACKGWKHAHKLFCITNVYQTLLHHKFTRAQATEKTWHSLKRGKRLASTLPCAYACGFHTL